MAWPEETPFNRYPSDLTDEEWRILEPILLKADTYTTGRPRKTDLREVLNAVFYINKTGCPWRYLPKCFPSYTVVSYYYHKWVDSNTWELINTALREQLRKKAVGTSLRARESLTARPSRGHRNPFENRALTGAS